MQFTIAFNLVVNQSTLGLKSNIQLTDNNEFIMTDSKNIQVQPSGTVAIPPLVFMSIGSKEIAVSAAENPSSDRQSIRITLPVTAEGSTLQGNLPFSGVEVSVTYQFIGYSDSGSLSVGSFSIPFPT